MLDAKGGAGGVVGVVEVTLEGPENFTCATRAAQRGSSNETELGPDWTNPSWPVLTGHN